MKNVYINFYILLYVIFFHNSIIAKQNIYNEFQSIQEEHLQAPEFSEVSIDHVTDFWNNRPCNIKHSSKVIGTKEYFDEVEHKKYFVEPHIPRFAEFDRWSGKQVLEIGCGIGTESINFARSGAHLSVIELSQKSLDLTRKRFQAFGLNAKFYEGNAESLELILPEGNKNQYDLVWSFGVIHHTPHPEKVIEGIKKFIKKGGELRIMLYSRISYKLFFIMRETGLWDFSKIDSLISRYSEAQVGCPVTHTYTKNEILKLLGNGWDKISITKTHIFPYKIDKYIQNIYEKEDTWKNVTEKNFKELEEELGWHYLIKAIYIGDCE